MKKFILAVAAAASLLLAGTRSPASSATFVESITIKNEVRGASIRYEIEKWPAGHENGCISPSQTFSDKYLLHPEIVQLRVYASGNCAGREISERRYPFRGPTATYYVTGSAEDPKKINFRMQHH